MQSGCNVSPGLIRFTRTDSGAELLSEEEQLRAATSEGLLMNPVLHTSTFCVRLSVSRNSRRKHQIGHSCRRRSALPWAIFSLSAGLTGS